MRPRYLNGAPASSALPSGVMRSSVTLAALLLLIITAVAGCTKPHANLQTIRVHVFPDYYVIDGRRYAGPLSGQLDRYAHSDQRVWIILSGSDPDLTARLPELAHLSGNANVSISAVTMRVAE
jgi:hypothetical protein